MQEPASAFSRIGHQIIAKIALQHLTPAAQKNIQRMLGTTTPEDAATWIDEMRSDPAYDYMKP